MKTVISKDQAGSALLLLTSIIVIVSLLGVAIIAVTQSFKQSGLSAGTGGRAHYLAESGARWAQHIFCNEGWEDGAERVITSENGEPIHVVREGDTFIATATVHGGTAMEARSQTIIAIVPCSDPEEPPPSGPKPGDFLIMGASDVEIRQHSELDGSVAALDADVDIMGVIKGDVVANTVTIRQGGPGHGHVTGSVYAKEDVFIRNNGAVTGNIYAQGTVTLSNTAHIEGNIYAKGSVTIENSASFFGDVHSCEGGVTLRNTADGHDGNIRAAWDVRIENSAFMEGNVDAGGNITVTSSSKPAISGNATSGFAISAPDGAIGGAQNAHSNPAPPVCPPEDPFETLALPPKTTFTAVGEPVGPNSVTSILPPGSYGKVELSRGSNRDLYVESGAYYFTSMNFGSNRNLYIDLSSGEDIHFFVEGDVDINSHFEVHISQDGETYQEVTEGFEPKDLASQIYLESHGSFSMGTHGAWFGTIYTPNSDTELAVQNHSVLIGSFYSGGTHSIHPNVPTLIFIPSNYLNSLDDE